MNEGFKEAKEAGKPVVSRVNLYGLSMHLCWPCLRGLQVELLILLLICLLFLRHPLQRMAEGNRII